MGDGGKEVTDTPSWTKNNQITGNENKFEDSPVYNFLNNLSPINQVKSTHITQIINPLSFSSIPSVFTSPNVSSLKGCRFIRRHQFSDPSKPEFSSDDVNNADKNKKHLDVSEKVDEQQQNLNPKPSEGEQAGGESSCERSKFIVGYEESITYYCGNFNPNLQPSSCLKAKHLAEYTCSSSTFVMSVEEASQRGIYGNEVNAEGDDQVGQSKEASPSDWKNLISNASDHLNFESPNNTESCKKLSKSHLLTALPPSDQVCENGESHDTIACQSIEKPGQDADSENVSGFYRGMKRRCLVFEMAGSGRKQQSDGNTSFSGQVQTSSGNNSSHCVLPGIGLHLNTLATTPKDKIVKQKPSLSSKLVIGPGSSVNFQPPVPGKELALTSSQREIDTFENGSLPMEETGQVSAYLGSEEHNQSSPKKKRRKSEQGTEGEAACKRCNCRKSKCLKLYCECFAAGVYCVEPCACIDCFNKPIHVETVLATRKQIESRNPLAFAPRVIRGSNSLSEPVHDSSRTPASARHKRGCNCKKSGCLKKYCECYQGGVGCSVNCRCEGCKNAFGRKNGSGLAHMEVEFEKYVTDVTEKNVSDKIFHKIAIPHEQKLDSVPVVTPLRVVRNPLSYYKKLCAQLTVNINHAVHSWLYPWFLNLISNYPQTPGESFQHPYSKEKPSLSFVSSNQVYGNESKYSEAVGKEEIPKILQESSPVNGVKSLSPNKKRVSPPQVEGMRGSRKLILRSIPSFPDLTTNQ